MASPTFGVQAVTVVDHDFQFDACFPGPAGTPSCTVTADALLPPPPTGARVSCIWRDGNTRQLFVARQDVARVEVYSDVVTGTPGTPPRHAWLRSLTLSGVAVSITVQRTTNRLVAAINNSTVPPTKRVDLIDPNTGGVFATSSCPEVSTYDHVMTNCDGTLGALVTGIDQNRYFVQLGLTCPYTLIVPLGPASEINNEYLVPDVWRNWWVATSLGASRFGGHLFKISATGSLTTFNNLGGRYVFPNHPYADGNPCDLSANLPTVFVAQQINADWGKVMKINQAGTPLVTVCYGPAPPPPPPVGCSPPPGFCPNYGSSQMDGPINVDTTAPFNPPGTGPRGRVWVSVRICGVRVFDAFNLDLCGRGGCGLGGACGGGTINQPLCDPTGNCPPTTSRGCPTYPCAQTPTCPGHADPRQPYRFPFVKGNGSPSFDVLIAPCIVPCASPRPPG